MTGSIASDGCFGVAKGVEASSRGLGVMTVS